MLVSPVLHAAGAQDLSVASSVWKVVISLVFVVAFIPACIWLMKRFQFAQMKLGKSDINIIHVQSLGTKEKLMLIEVQGEKLLIGVTPNTISYLKSFPSETPSFASVLNDVGQKNASDRSSENSSDRSSGSPLSNSPDNSLGNADSHTANHQQSGHGKTTQ